MSQPLPFEPESLVLARNRYPDALTKLWIVERILLTGAKRPGLIRKHVFDFDSGLRLIISMELASTNPIGERGPFEHVSASWMDTPQEGSVILDTVIRTYSYVSKRDPMKQPKFQHFTEEGVYHMLFDRLELTERDYDPDTGELIMEETGE